MSYDAVFTFQWESEKLPKKELLGYVKVCHRLTIACSKVRVSESTVFPQAADDDGDAWEEED